MGTKTHLCAKPFRLLSLCFRLALWHFLGREDLAGFFQSLFRLVDHLQRHTHRQPHHLSGGRILSSNPPRRQNGLLRLYLFLYIFDSLLLLLVCCAQQLLVRGHWRVVRRTLVWSSYRGELYMLTGMYEDRCLLNVTSWMRSTGA